MKKFFTILLLLFLPIYQLLPHCGEAAGKIKKIYSTKQIEHNLTQKLNQFNKRWSIEEYNTAVMALYIGEKHYRIDHKLILSIISVESKFKIKLKRYNKNKTIDYCLTQQNSCEINSRYKKAKQIYNLYNIKTTDSKYDIALNIMACYIYLNDIRATTNYNTKKIIMAYNLGIRGASLSNRQKTGEKYFQAILREYNNI